MSIPDIASTRPTLAAWLAEYAAIEADYLASLRATGIDFAPRDDAEKRRRERETKRAETKEKAIKITSRVFISVSATLAYLLAVIALGTLDAAYDGEATAFISLIIASAVFRIVTDSFCLSVKSRGIIVLTYINLVLSALSLAACGTPFVREATYGAIAFNVIASVACIVLESIKISQFKKQFRN